MLSAIFHNVSRAPAPSHALMNEIDASNISWSFMGKSWEKRGRKFYNAARVRLIDQDETRIFQAGDCVFVGADGTKEKWVAHVVKFMEIVGDDGEPGTDTECMRVILRWFYKRKDIHEKTNLRNVRDPLPNELYWSDHVETKGNPVECIEGRAFVRKNRKDVIALRARPPAAYWEGDRFYICRYYYGTDEPDPPPLREFVEHELAYLLQNPSVDELYQRVKQLRRQGNKLKHDADGSVLMSARRSHAEAGSSSKGKRSKLADEQGSERPYFTCACCEQSPERPEKAQVVADEANEQDSEPQYSGPQNGEDEYTLDASKKRRADGSAAASDKPAKRPRMTSTVIDGGNLASINNPSAVVLNASTELDFNSMDFDATDSYAKTTQEEEGSLNSKTRSRTDASPENESKSVSKSIAKDEELIDDLEEIFDAPPPITTDFTFGLHSETKGEDVVYEDAVSEEVAGEDDAGDVSAALNNADEKVPCTMDAESFTQWRSSFETMTPSDRKEFERLISKYKLPHSPNSA